MVICGSYTFKSSVSKDITKRKTMIERRIPAHLLACLLPLVVKELKINVEQGRVTTTSNITKH